MDQGLLGEITGFSATVNRNNDVLLSLFPIGRAPGAGICLDFGVYYITALVSLLNNVSDDMVEDKGTAIGLGIANAVNRIKDVDAPYFRKRRGKIVIVLFDVLFYLFL